MTTPLQSRGKSLSVSVERQHTPPSALPCRFTSPPPHQNIRKSKQQTMKTDLIIAGIAIAVIACTAWITRSLVGTVIVATICVIIVARPTPQSVMRILSPQKRPLPSRAGLGHNPYGTPRTKPTSPTAAFHFIPLNK